MHGRMLALRLILAASPFVAGGCFLVAAILLLVIAAIAFVGFNGDRIDDFKSSIPVLGGMVVGSSPRGSWRN